MTTAEQQFPDDDVQKGGVVVWLVAVLILVSACISSCILTGRKSASFTPAEAAYIFPQLGAVMGGVDAAINSNKEAIIQKSK